MYFHVQLIDYPETPEQRERSRLDHWQYFDDHRECFIARGATVTDDDKRILSSVLFVEFDEWEQVRTFVDNEPHNKNGVYREIHIKQWGFALKRRQVDFPRKSDQLSWYIRGYGKAGMHERREELLSAHRAYFKSYDMENFITRGPILSDDGEEWQGSGVCP